ncbi:MAG TPA: type III pantothenate kinase [Gammaproteobacteria bacterium]|jgi:type III pantothenate kinase|nr:type III pantothenate kinase [Gammaproteobacteria bacterium]
MLLCLDVGNTHILGGVFRDGELAARFRYATPLLGTSDQFGIFLINILRVKGIDPDGVKSVAVSSVVPGHDYTLRHTILSYFSADYYTLRPDQQQTLKIHYKNPSEVGADRIANAMGAIKLYPDKNMIIIDMGTATTLCGITKDCDYLGGAILPGMRLGTESLRSNTAKLMEVNIEAPVNVIGVTTHTSIQSGLFYGQFGALKELITAFKREAFANQEVLIVATGGFAQLYKDMNLFDVILPDLVLDGLRFAYEHTR